MDVFEGQTGERLRKALIVVAWLLVGFLAVEIVSGASNLRYIGAGTPATNTIAVSGHGEILATPDIATFTFSVVSDKPTVAAAQADATQKANDLTAYVKSAGIDEKDIKTTDYSVSPRYEYQQASACGPGIYCPPGKQVLTGYEVRQTTQVKVRDTQKAGDLLTGVGSKGATEVSGLTLTLDDPTGVQAQAREKAIADAKDKAAVLAKQLGVSLVRIVSFNENGSAPVPMPMAYKSMGAADSASAPAISTGQNTVTDDVSITYEIR